MAREKRRAKRECSKWKLCVCVGALLVSALGPQGALGQSIPAGVSYLSGSQNPSHLWGDPEGSEFRDSTVVLDALGALGRSSSAGYLQGVASLQAATASNNDYLARRVVSLGTAGIGGGALTTPLLDAQEAEEFNSSVPNFPAGGWGVGSGFATDTLDTALVLKALRAAGFADALTVVSEQVAVGATSAAHGFSFPSGATGLAIFIRATTGAIRLSVTIPTGGTGSLDRNPSNVPVNFVGIPQQTGTYTLLVQNMDTVPISYSLEVHFTTVDRFSVELISRALRYLGLAQNLDGGWGIARGEDSSLMITAETLLTLEAYGGAFAPRSAIDNGVNWLVTNARNADGGFGSVAGTSTPYETALAMLAIHGASPGAPSLGPARAFLAASQLANGSWANDAYQTALAIRGLGGLCVLDVDLSGTANVATDIVFVARNLLGLTPVPASFRVSDPTLPSDADIAGRVGVIRPQLDVDGNGSINVATDIIYIARKRLGLAPVPQSFRVLDPSIPSDTIISANIDALCQ